MSSVTRAVILATLLSPGIATAHDAHVALPATEATASPITRFDTASILTDPNIAADGPARPIVGPIDPQAAPIAAPDSSRRVTFGQRVGAVKWELAGAVAVVTALNVRSIRGETQGFRFVDEGYFGRDTGQLGVDKLAHAWNGYVFTDVLYKRMARKVGGGAQTAWTAAALGMALQTYGEIYDGFHRGSGFSWQDMAFNAVGVGFSVVRQTVPGVAEKVDFRTYFVPPNRPEGLGDPDRFEKQRFLLAVKGAGFAGIRDTPLRFVELHLGYRGKNFSSTDRRIGLTPERRIFVGVGFNVAELFRRRTGPVASVARSTLEYLQLPYTSAHVDVTR